MGFDRYRCILDCIFPFSKLLEYRRRFHFQKYRTAFVSDKKKCESKSGSLSPTVSIPNHDTSEENFIAVTFSRWENPVNK